MSQIDSINLTYTKKRSLLSRLMFHFRLSLTLLIFVSSLMDDRTSNAQAPVTFERVLELLELEVKEEKLLTLIKSQPTLFTLSDDQIAKLKKAGASEAVLAALTPKASAMVVSDISAYVMILDASGSMLETTGDGKTKWEIAKKAASDLIQGIPEGLSISVVIYGHDKNRACEVDVLRQLTPITISDKAEMIRRINAIEPAGKTPIGKSLRIAAGLVGKSRGLSKLLLITDGIETCEGDPVAEAKAFSLAEESSRSVDVIGFGLPSKESATIAQIATAGKGKYIDARTGNDLIKAFDTVKQELAQKLHVTEGAVTLKASKDISTPTELPYGKYTKARLAPKDFHYWNVQFPAGKSTIVYDVKLAAEGRDNLIGSVAIGSLIGNEFKEETYSGVSMNEIRGRAVINLSFESPTTKIVRVFNGPFTAALHDYHVGVFGKDSKFGVPFLVNCPEILPMSVGTPVTSPLLGVAKDFYKDCDVYFKVKIPAGDSILEVEWSGDQPQEFACLRSVTTFDLQGVRLNLLEALNREKQCKVKFLTAEEQEVLLQVRAAARSEKVTLKLTPVSE